MAIPEEVARHIELAEELSSAKILLQNSKLRDAIMGRKVQALDEFLRVLRERFGDSIEEVILFGSYARGEYDEESDIDLLIIGEVDFDELMDVVTEVLLKYGELVSPIVIKPTEFKRRNDSFIKTVIREGKPLYSSTSTP